MISKKHIWLSLIGAFFTITMISVLSIISISNDMFGLARVINYAGIVRGATQRLVKLEIADHPNDELISYIDTILNELQAEEEGIHQLKKLEDESFQKSLVPLNETWDKLQIEIAQTRLLGYEKTDIIAVSEKHFGLADDSVSFAEYSSDRLLLQYHLVKYILIFATALLFATLILLARRLNLSNKENKRIEMLSHIDVPTGLPSKSKCQQKFEQYGTLSTNVEYGMIMFDLNNLKQTNDVLGHNVGDLLILDFATLLKDNIKDNAFAARFGGDEFIVIWDDAKESEIQSYINKIRCGAAALNSENYIYEISFAVGYALSAFKSDVTLEILLKEADKNMYINKHEIKNNLTCDLH